MATSEIPLPTALGESCLTVNGVAVPMLFVSSQQINGQLPFNVDGNATDDPAHPRRHQRQLQFHHPARRAQHFPHAARPDRTPGSPPSSAPTTTSWSRPPIPFTPMTPSSSTPPAWAAPCRPSIPACPSPSDPLPSAVIQPTVTLGGVALDIQYAGLVPG